MKAFTCYTFPENLKVFFAKFVIFVRVCRSYTFFGHCFIKRAPVIGWDFCNEFYQSFRTKICEVFFNARESLFIIFSTPEDVALVLVVLNHPS